jgi:hypothetical protein
MTPEQEFLVAMLASRNTWATESNATTDKAVLDRLCEQFIEEMEDAFKKALPLAQHPPPPPPRIQP